jgi:hypothetical protein
MTNALWLSKITIASIGCNPSLAKTLRQPIPVAQMLGIASKIKPVPNTKPKTTFRHKIAQALVGQFEAINLQDQIRFRSGIIYFPGMLHNQIVENISFPFEFAFEFTAQPFGRDPGYTYIVRSLLSR